MEAFLNGFAWTLAAMLMLHTVIWRSRSLPAWLLFVLVLRPLIRRNYRQRATHKAPDRWYWADRLAVGWGYFVDFP